MGIIYGKKIGAGIGYGGDPPMSVVDGSLNAFVSEQGTSNPTITIQWANPEDENWAGTLIVRKSGDIPASVNDGVQVYDGVNNSCTDTGEYGETYYYRAFTYNERRKYNTKSVSCSILPIAEISGEDLNVGAKIKFQYDTWETTATLVQKGRPSPSYNANTDGLWFRFDQVLETSPMANSTSTINKYSTSIVHTNVCPSMVNKISDPLKNKILTVSVPSRVAANGNQETEVQLFCPSLSELGFASGIWAVGSVLEYYSSGTADRRLVYDSKGITPQTYWTRDGTLSVPNGDTNKFYAIGENGNYTAQTCNLNYGVPPLFIISKDTKFSANPNEDGSYNLM